MKYKYTALLPLAAATAAGFVIPDEVAAQQFALGRDSDVKTGDAKKTDLSWWNSLPGIETVQSALGSAVDAFEQGAGKLKDYIPEVEFGLDSDAGDFLYGGHHGKHGKKKPSNLTAYEIIKKSPYSTRFAKLVDEYPDIAQGLNSTALNVTVFVPTDAAFDKIPDHHHGGDDDEDKKKKKPSREFVEKVLKYHLVPGYYPAGRVLASSTLPTALKEAELGGNPQRLRVSVGLLGVRVNFYSKVVAINIFATNGVLHGVDSLLIPPPAAETLVSLLPQRFSQLLLAGERTGLAGEEYSLRGLTIFAPTNGAFARLGPRANAFLFNTETGKKYLKALILYHVVVDETLYSDAYYNGHKKDDGGDDDEKAATSQKHFDLPTALGGKHLSVDIARHYGFVTIKVNGFTRVAVADAPARDGVVHAVSSVLIPPREGASQADDDDADGQGEIDVADLVERLRPYVVEGGESDL